MRFETKNCPYCKGKIRFDTKDQFVQCPHCTKLLACVQKRLKKR